MRKTIVAALACLAALCMLTGALAQGGGLEAVMASFELGEEMMPLDGTDLEDVYGIDPADVAQFAAAINDTGIKADEIVLVEAVDADAAARVQAILEGRLQDKLNELENYLPGEYAVAKACAVEAEGCFVAMIVAPNAGELTDLYRQGIAAQ